jgi:hypothetical protein
MSDEFQLPPLPPTGSLPSKWSRKRARDFDISSSSDPPTFSSDPPEALGIGQDQHKDTAGANDRKRQYRGPWWGNTNVRPRETRKFKRAQDSGVWLGSEESEPPSDLSLEETGRTIETPSQQAVSRLMQEVEAPRIGQMKEDMAEDEGASTEEACKQERRMHEQMAQVSVAENIVLNCLENGKENIDLS